jgi:hypothetical protein
MSCHVGRPCHPENPENPRSLFFFLFLAGLRHVELCRHLFNVQRSTSTSLRHVHRCITSSRPPVQATLFSTFFLLISMVPFSVRQIPSHYLNFRRRGPAKHQLNVEEPDMFVGRARKHDGEIQFDGCNAAGNRT